MDVCLHMISVQGGVHVMRGGVVFMVMPSWESQEGLHPLRLSNMQYMLRKQNAELCTIGGKRKKKA